MRLRRARFELDATPEDAEGPLRGLGLGTDSPMGGYLVAETLLFRTVNAIEDRYLHLEHTTIMEEWFPSDGLLTADVTVGAMEDDGIYPVRAEISLDARHVMTVSVVLRRGGVRKRRGASRTPRSPRAAAPRPTRPIGRWAVVQQAAFNYSSWCHPNLHTDASLAREMGFEDTLAQGLMIQNKALLLASGGTPAVPLRVHSRFRAPVLVGVPLEFHADGGPDDGMVSVVDPEGRTTAVVTLGSRVELPAVPVPADIGRD